MLAVALLVVLPWQGQARGADEGKADVIFDLIPLLAPADGEKMLTVFGSQDFEPGSACILKYRRASDGVFASLDIIHDRHLIRSLFRTSPTQLTTWWADPSLCSPNTDVSKGADWIRLSAPGPTHSAQSVLINQSKVTLSVRSYEAFQKRFGAPFFRAETNLYRGNKNNLFAAMKFPRRSLADYERLSLELEIETVKVLVETGCVDGTPPPNQAAQKCYDQRKHRTQFRIGFGNVSWQDPRCSRPDTSDPVCKYQNRFIQTAFSIYNEAFAFFEGDFHVQKRGRRPSIPIYRIDLRACLPPGTDRNPFRTVGGRAKLKCDLLSGLKQAIFEAERFCHLPPRLQKPDGTHETDAEYLAHYGLSVANIGFEVTGLSDASFDVYAFSLKGTKIEVGASKSSDYQPLAQAAYHRTCD